MNPLAILVVDDHPIMKDVIAQILEDAGHEVRTAGNGFEAIRQMTEMYFDVLVTDVVMPGMDGLELIGEVRRRYPGVRILATSAGGDGFSEDEVLTVARRLGAGAVLTKPFIPGDLVQMINLLCPTRAVAHL